MKSRAVLYLRLSAVVDDSTSIARQEADLRALADRQGWDVVAALVDEGISGRKARAKAAQAVRMITDNDADVLAVWKLDRFTRQGWDGLGELSRALDARKRSAEAGTTAPAMFHALQDGLTSDQSAFRLIAGVLSEVARSEADNAATRIKNSIAYRKSVNKFTGGPTVPFGYRSIPAPDGVGRVLELDPAEAAIVREVAARLLEDVEPLAKIASDLTARRVATSKSAARKAARRGEPAHGLDRGRWTSSTLRSLWTSDLLLGRSVYRGELVRDENGLPAEVWPSILDLPTLEALRARLGVSRALMPYPEPPKRSRRTRRARLLSGVAYCAACGSKMYVTSSNGRPVYACGGSWNGGACPSPKIAAENLEDYVAGRFLAVAGAWPEIVQEEIHSSATTAADLAETEAALREATAAMLEDGADVPALVARIAALKARRSELRAMPSTVEVVTRETGRTLAEAWAQDEDTDRRRAVLLWALDHITIAPTASRRSPIDPERVAFYWNS